MDKRIFIEQSYKMTRMALTEDGALCEYQVEPDEGLALMGSVYLGFVQNVLPGMQAAFVDIGDAKNAYLHAEDIGQRELALGEGEAKIKQPPIRKMLHPGEEIMVQVVKEQEGEKGARVTTHIALPGRLMVLTPKDGYVGVSKRIKDEALRARVKRRCEEICPEGMGLIVRTAAAEASDEALLLELQSLLSLWKMIQKKAVEQKAPCVLHKEEGLLQRTLRDLFKEDVSALVLSDKELYDQTMVMAKMYVSDLVGRVELHQSQTALFDFYGIEAMADEALNRRVRLPCGGTLMIDQTEALTVIDVNTGQFVGKLSLQDTVFRLNLEAVEEIARQIRLRNLNGIIVIDLIDMEIGEHRQKVIEALREALKKDRCQTNIVGLTGLGLLEMTRKKSRQKLSLMVEQVCPVCQGTGRVLRTDFVARRALREANRKQIYGDIKGLTITARPKVAKAIRELGQKDEFMLEVSENLPKPYELWIRGPENG